MYGSESYATTDTTNRCLFLYDGVSARHGGRLFEPSAKFESWTCTDSNADGPAEWKFRSDAKQQ